MKGFHAATIVAVIVTTLLAARVLVLRASRPTVPRMLARVRFDLDWVLRGAKDRIDDWIAASIARRERNAVVSMPFDPDRQRCDGSLDCRCIDGCCSRHECLARMADRSAVREENGR